MLTKMQKRQENSQKKHQTIGIKLKKRDKIVKNTTKKMLKKFQKSCY